MTQDSGRTPAKLGLFFFAALGDDAAATYRTVLEAARIADRSGLTFVSTPERHFHRFGGAFPNAAVLSAAIAAVTENIQIRAGSVITPLSPNVRTVENWSLVDSISGGRVAISVGSGWNMNDFVIAPDEYAGRRERATADVYALREIWRTGKHRAVSPTGEEVEVEVYPRPVQPELQMWTTSSRSIETFRAAGHSGTNLLTHLEQQEIGELAEKIEAYRSAYSANWDGSGTVTLMMHTYVGATAEEARSVGATALRDYLLTAIDLEARAVSAGGRMSGGREGSDLLQQESARHRLAEVGARRLLDGRSLIGSLDECAAVARSVHAAGVDEIGCLIDFVSDPVAVLDGVTRLGELQRQLRSPSAAA